jgi:hypothetical protein
MPFRHVQNDYQPEQIVEMTEALNLAWPQVLLANGASTPREPFFARTNLELGHAGPPDWR